MTNSKVIVLNYDYSFLSIVSAERAFSYIERGKVVVEKFSEKVLSTAEKSFSIPKIVRFVYLVKEVYKRKIPWTKKNVLIRDKYTCGYCGKKSDKMTIDHVIPKSRGGKNTFDNTVAACFECNNKKDDRLPEEARMYPRHALVQPTITDYIRSIYDQTNVSEVIKSIWD